MSVQTEQVYFKEEQSFRQLTWLWILMAASSLFVVVILGTTFMQAPDVDGLVVSAILTCLVMGGAFWLMWAMKLIVEVDADYLHVRFFPFIKKDIPLHEITHWEARTYRPIMEYGGWGIRFSWMGKGMAYNVRGNRGVQLEMASAKSLLIGSQRAEELAEALAKAKSGS